MLSGLAIDCNWQVARSGAPHFVQEKGDGNFVDEVRTQRERGTTQVGAGGFQPLSDDEFLFRSHSCAIFH
jgi:hypothetical protein